MTEVLYFEDFAAGQTFRSDRRQMTAEAIRQFASEFDPQPFHTDPEAATDSLFGGLIASGWHTAAITMRLLVDSEFKPANGFIGAGVEELRWPQPVWPDDTLHLMSEVLETRPARSRPDHGMLKLRTTTLNQNHEPVQIMVAHILVVRRSVSGS